MADLVLYGDLILAPCTYLKDELSKRPEAFARGAFVSRSVPSTRRDRMVVLSNRGGVAVNALLRRSIVDVNFWASDEHEADLLAELVSALLDRANSGVLLDVSVQTSAQELSPDGGQPRRYVRLSVTHRADSLG